MRVIIEHESSGAITTIAFAESQSPELELTPAIGRQVVYANPERLGLPSDLSTQTREELARHRSAILNCFRIEGGKLVRIER